MTYCKFIDDYTGEAYGSCEIFHVDVKDAFESEAFQDEDGVPMPGWYWWACFPGCMPDGDPMGPFETEQEAMDNAEVA